MNHPSVLRPVRLQLQNWASGGTWANKGAARRFLENLPSTPPEVGRCIGGLECLGNNCSKLLWRLRTADLIATHNQSPEKVIEKRVARDLAQDGWSNQVATAAGLSLNSGDCRRNIDLVKSESEPAGGYRFVELKVDSNNPVYAAIELLEYAALYLWWRGQRQLHRQGREDRGLLDARKLTLEVLAPHGFYTGWDTGLLDKLRQLLECGLNAAATAPLTIVFRFSILPEVSALSSTSELRAAFESPRPL